MADNDNAAKRTVGRILQFFGISNSKAISNMPNGMPQSGVHYGMYSRNELQHMPGLSGKEQQKPKDKPEDIMQYLQSVSSNTRRTMENLKNLKIVAPEIGQAKQIIISSIISPTDMQTDLVSVAVNCQTLTDDVNGRISKVLNDHFNDVFHFGSTLTKWLEVAGFEQGAKAVVVLPHQQLDVLNAVADTWNPEDVEILKDTNSDKSVETLFTDNDVLKELICGEDVRCAVEALMDDFGLEVFNADDKLNDKTRTKVINDLVKHNFDIIKEGSQYITVTKNLSYLTKSKKNISNRITKFAKEAEQQYAGFKADSKDERPSFGVFSISDVINVEKEQMPIILEYSSDSVIPACAPRDVTNHLGYWIVLDESGQGAQGEYAFNGGLGTGVGRLAFNAAKATYGNDIMQTFDMNHLGKDQTMDMMARVFSVAVNKLLSTKMKSEGLAGLDVNLHNAVGKSIFFNLLAKTKVRLVFVPEPMMVYYRFDHREDGTGKSFLEDIDFILGLRTTLTIAKIMAAVDNATKHRTIEVNVDEQNKNPLETIENVRRAFLTKYAPSFTTDPGTVAESILNQHVTITPKALAGTTEDLSVNIDSKYGSSQAPDSEMMDILNNWMGIGLLIPPSALNQLAETEYSRSIVSTNLFFSNAVRKWQNTIKPFNKKFATNYVCSHHGLLAQIRKILKDQGKDVDKTVDEGISADVDKTSNTTEAKLKEVLASIEVNLPTPNVATSKAHHEEIQAYMESVQSMVDKVFPDDIAGGDSDAQAYLGSLRAVIVGGILREFMTKIGFHELAAIPTTDTAVTDEIVENVTFLLNMKRRVENMAKLHKGETSQPSDGGSSDDEL